MRKRRALCLASERAQRGYIARSQSTDVVEGLALSGRGVRRRRVAADPKWAEALSRIGPRRPRGKICLCH